MAFSGNEGMYTGSVWSGGAVGGQTVRLCSLPEAPLLKGSLAPSNVSEDSSQDALCLGPGCFVSSATENTASFGVRYQKGNALEKESLGPLNTVRRVV